MQHDLHDDLPMATSPVLSSIQPALRDGIHLVSSTRVVVHRHEVLIENAIIHLDLAEVDDDATIELITQTM